MKATIEWDMDVKIIQNRFIMKQLYLVFGIPSLLIWIFLSVLTIGEGIDFSNYIRQIAVAPAFFIGFILLSYLVILIIFRNKYPMTFQISEKEAMMLTRKEQRKKNRRRSMLLSLLGAVSGSPSAAGAGIINADNNDRTVKLKSVRRVILFPKQATILVKGDVLEHVYLFCTEVNYGEVETHLREKLDKSVEWKKKG